MENGIPLQEILETFSTIPGTFIMYYENRTISCDIGGQWRNDAKHKEVFGIFILAALVFREMIIIVHFKVFTSMAQEECG